MNLRELFEAKKLDVPTPTVAELAKKHNVSTDRVERELAKGIKVEMEHTTDPKVAREIALDHLNEKIDYYTKLKQVEEDIEIYTVFDIHREFFEEVSKLDINLFESKDDYLKLKKILDSYKSTPVVGKDYVYVSISTTPAGKIMNIASFDRAYKLIDISDQQYVFSINGKKKAYPETGSIKGDFAQTILMFDDKDKFDKMMTMIHLQIDNDWNISKKNLTKQVEESLSEDQDLDEVSMSPGALSSFAKSDVAKAMTIGFEAEMAIDGMEESEPDYDDVEPDWDADQTISFDRDWRRQVERFFTSGDGMNSRRDVERALEAIDEDYMEWISEQYQEWLDSEESAETITKILKKYDEDISDEDIEDTIKFKKNNYWNSIEDDVREEWESDNMNDESFVEFMEYNEMDTMRGILDRDGGLSWPYYTEPEMGGGEVSAEEVEMSFAETTGYRTKVGSGYHSAKREPGVWIFEPDSSIEPAGIELVSPPMPLDQGLEALDKFFAWAKEYGAGANKSTGFHMGVSIPDQTMDNVDHLKLILFLGDEYVLKQFGREANTFTRSSLKKIKQILSAGNVDPREVLNNFKKGLNGEAAKITRNLIVPKTDRYVSVNIKNNYIEFRSAGGDYFEKIPEIKNTLLRYVRAMSIAADPESDKNEYAKKLYKLIASTIPEEEQTINYFAKYAAGQITQSELKGAVKDVQQQRADKKNPQKAPAKPAPKSEPELPSGRFIVNLDSNGSLWTIKYTQLSTGQRGAFDVRASSYSQVTDWFRNNHPELNLNDITQTAAQRSAGRQNESLVNTLIDQYVTYLEENFADGKVKGKSRPGRVKKAGASCKGSVSELRARAKKYGGEKGKMYHWCANMKGGKK